MLPPPRILLNDFQRQWLDIGPEAVASFAAVGESGWYVLGDRVRRFEHSLSAMWGGMEAVGVASGLDAIEIALRAAGLEPGDRVLTTPLSAFATTLAIVKAGGVPVFCDTDATGRMDLAEARAALQAMPGIRFLVPVHLFGFPLDSAELGAVIEEFGLRMIEDCAQSIGAVSETGEPTGRRGIAAATSFYPTKNLGAMGDGGAILTPDSEFAARCRRLRDYGQSAKYVHAELGWNSRLDEVHAALLGEVLLPRLPSWTNRRREIAAMYLEAFAGPEFLGQVVPLAQEARMGSLDGACWHLFPVRVIGRSREELAQHLRAAGILTGVHYPALIPDQEALRSVPFACYGALPVATALAGGELSLPIHPYLRDDEVEEVIAATREWCENRPDD